MSALLTSLPGDIPGLLRDGSVLRHLSRRAVAVQVTEGFVLVAYHASGADEEIEIEIEIEIEGGTISWDLVALDLTDRHGRVDAAWWAMSRLSCGFFDLTNPQCFDTLVLRKALIGATMEDEQIDTLARLVLRLAGRAA